MQNIADKADSTAGSTGELTASEYNNHKNELQGAVTRSGQTLSAATLLQLAKAMFINGIGANAAQDGGSVNSILLSPPSGSSGLVVPDDYSHFNGGILVFTKTDSNTSTSVTVNFGQTGTELGAKSLKRPDGTNPQPGDVSGKCTIQWDNSSNYWVLLENGSGVFAENITSTNTFIPENGMNHLLVPDTGLGDLTQTIDDPAFVGQKVIVAPIDDGICYVRGTGTIDADGYKSGIYDGGSNTGLYVTKNHKAELIGVEKGGVLVWQVTVEETAEFLTGDFTIKMSSNGDIFQSEITSGISSISQSELFGSTSGTSYRSGNTEVTYPVAFDLGTDIEITYGVSIAAENLTLYHSIVINATTTSGYKRFVVSRAQNITIDINVKSKGKF